MKPFVPLPNPDLGRPLPNPDLRKRACQRDRLHRKILEMSDTSRAVADAYNLRFDDKTTQRRRKCVALKRQLLIKRVEKLRRKMKKGGRIENC